MLYKLYKLNLIMMHIGKEIVLCRETSIDPQKRTTTYFPLYCLYNCIMYYEFVTYVKRRVFVAFIFPCFTMIVLCIGIVMTSYL